MTHSRSSAPAASHRQTSPATFAAARAVLAAADWTEGTDFRLRPTSVRPDEVLAAPVVGGNDTMPGTSSAEWADQEHKAAWFAAARTLRQVMTDARWTATGTTGHGTYYRRPATAAAGSPDAAELAAAAPGAPVRLLAIAAEPDVAEGDLDAAVREAAHEEAADAYNTGVYPGLDDEKAHTRAHDEAAARASAINTAGLAAQPSAT